MVNIVVCQKDDGSNGWQDIPAFYHELDSMFTRINNIYSNIPLKGYSLTCDPNHIHVVDSKIRFELNEVYFIQNSDFNNMGYLGWQASQILSYLFQVHPEARGAMNHIFTQPEYNLPAWGMFHQNILGESAVSTERSMYSDSKVVWEDHVNHFAHEYGHALGIMHTYNGEKRDITHYDFLDGTFGNCVEPQLLAGGVCEDPSCNPGPTQICYFQQCFRDLFPPPYHLMAGRNENTYISPKMTGRFHRSLSLYKNSFVLNTKNMSRYVKEKQPYIEPYHIVNDETWDFAIKMYQDIIVKAGNTLVIKCEVLMPVNGKIAVEPGAKLIIDGGNLKNAHDQTWAGIEVHGRSDMEQSDQNQGVLILKNDAVIENAHNAISVWEPGNFCSSGGIIRADNAIFRNNKRNVEFIKYPQSVCSNPPIYTPNLPNKSYFKNCLFETNDDYFLLDSQTPIAMITLWGVKGIAFIGCDFINTTSVATSEERSKAIYSIDADFAVVGYCNGIIPIGDPCPDYVPSTFTGFNTGVHATGAEQNPTPKIKNSVFDKNMLGIYFYEADHGTALFNDFTVGNHPYPAPTQSEGDASYHTAIKAESSSSFTIEENVVSRYSNATDSTHGIVVVNSGSQSVELYKNEYNNLTSASIAVGDNNDNIGGFYGLRFICNQNNQNRHDFEIRKDDLSNSGYVSIYQSGLDGPLHAAGNTFSPSDGFNENYVHFDFYSNGDYLYRYDETLQGQTPNPDEIYVYGGSLTLEAGGTTNTCLTHFPPIGIVTPFELDKFQSTKEGYYNLLYTYHQFIDKGNTEGTLNDIALAWPKDAWSMRNELMARSPYNSDTVLIAAADRNILPHGMLLEILIANSDALRNGRVIEHVKCCINDPMPMYMTDILESAKSVRTARTLMEHTISNLHAAMSRAHRKLMLHYLNDTLGTHPDTLIVWYDEMKTREGRYALAMEQVHQNKYMGAHITLDSLENSMRLTGEQKTELAETRKYVNFLETVYNDGRTIAELDTAEIYSLKAIANKRNGGIAAARADNILCFFYGFCKQPAGYPKSAPGAPKKPKPKLEDLLSQQNLIKSKPNPADQYVELEYFLLFEEDNTYLNVWDIQGRLVESWHIGRSAQGLKLMDTRHLGIGLYITEIVQGGKQVFSDKFIVRH